MRTTKHGAAQVPKQQRWALGIPVVLLAAGVVVCLIAVLPTRGGAAPRRTADASVAGAKARVPSGSGSTDVTADATTAPTPSPLTRPKSSPRTTTPSSRPPAATPTPHVASSTPRVATNTPRTPSAATSGSLAGRIKPGVRYRGVATAYEAGDGNGACLYGPSGGDLMIAAMNHTDYESAKACGAHVLVRAANGASITVRIVNECPLPCAPGQLDLSQQAFAKLAKLSVGRLPITWTLVSPAASGTISIRYKDGSSQYWCGVQAIGHRNPLAALEVQTAKGWRKLHRTDYNYFLSTDGSGCGKAIRITDIYGERLTINGIAVKPDVAQRTGVQFARH
ncbi:expansin (peptidoglycan-binding protein) [Kribbella voronezhensis]|uniref:Expansin (Peptidoglycan-binding protein) n=1 Tax=Kribbella voronezhensis TaxID=2512212 RepID=A0A4R7TB22_9ACTN|nr:expansin EXLX1 family cellulose-binding protein [Kribbella voronezhensis]TDU89240.1 expansin (peptidoglycan-binding protein) [Kribbella voronezhensis]